jgi:alkyldihydroxyacetonephosphate synthase
MPPNPEKLRRALPGLRVSTDAADLVAYGRDLWPRHHLEVRAGQPAAHRPGAVAWPSSTAEVSELVRWARRERVGLVPFGAGSGVCGAVLPDEDVVLVDMKRMARVRRLDSRAAVVEVEAGHMGLPLEQSLERAGTTLGHFPSSILCSTVGGWVAARSAGQCSGAYGKIEDMTLALECVTGRGEVVVLQRRHHGPDLVPLVLGSEGTLAFVTAATFRLHPAPSARSFGAWSFSSTREGWSALREVFQSGLRPAVARLYDPFDAMLARRGSTRGTGPRRSRGDGASLRWLLKRPRMLNALLDSRLATRALGGAMIVLAFEGDDGSTRGGIEGAASILGAMGGRPEGEGPARRWFQHRYSISYRQAPVFANGAFVDTMEVAARWSRLGDVYDAVRRALGPHVFVMAHFSHAYPDGCCIYFSFVGSADPERTADLGWDAACAVAYERAWKDALAAVIAAGGTLAHHHGVGRSKAPFVEREMGEGVGVVRALMRAFDPDGIMNRGNLLPTATGVSAATATATATSTPTPTSTPAAVLPSISLDRESLLVSVAGHVLLRELERTLNESGLTLDAAPPSPDLTVGRWLARGAPGSRDPLLDPVDQRFAGMDATLAHGPRLSIRPAPRRSVGPDLTALLIGTEEKIGRIDRAWLRVHRTGVTRPVSPPVDFDRDPPVSAGEQALLDFIAAEI